MIEAGSGCGIGWSRKGSHEEEDSGFAGISGFDVVDVDGVDLNVMMCGNHCYC